MTHPTPQETLRVELLMALAALQVLASVMPPLDSEDDRTRALAVSLRDAAAELATEGRALLDGEVTKEELRSLANRADRIATDFATLVTQ
jgi:hypothetical protein